MRDWIAVIITVLGVLLVLAGAALIVLRALAESKTERGNHAAPDGPTSEIPAVSGSPSVSTRLAQAVRRTTNADRLILWGIVLLVLAAIAAGAITFNLGAAGGEQ